MAPNRGGPTTLNPPSTAVGRDSDIPRIAVIVVAVKDLSVWKILVKKSENLEKSIEHFFFVYLFCNCN